LSSRHGHAAFKILEVQVPRRVEECERFCQGFGHAQQGSRDAGLRLRETFPPLLPAGPRCFPCTAQLAAREGLRCSCRRLESVSQRPLPGLLPRHPARHRCNRPSFFSRLSRAHAASAGRASKRGQSLERGFQRHACLLPSLHDGPVERETSRCAPRFFQKYSSISVK